MTVIPATRTLSNLLTMQRSSFIGRQWTRRWVVLALVLAAALGSLVSAADVASGENPVVVRVRNPDGKDVVQTAYRAMEFRGLRIRVLGAGDALLLRPASVGALESLRPLSANDGEKVAPHLLGVQPAKRDILPLPVETDLAGSPGLVVQRETTRADSVTFELSEPARVYAYLDWRNAVALTADGWRRFQANPTARHSIYYRDFPAGRNALKLADGFFTGVGISPLARLSAAEKIVPVGESSGAEPALSVHSFNREVQEVRLAYSWRQPGRPEPVVVRETQVRLQPGENRVPLPAERIDEGVLYWIDVVLRGAGAEWKLSLPFGRFPPPPPDASVQAPILPYGAYMKIATNDDSAIYDRLLVATFYQMRRLKMNTVVLNTAEAPRRHLDLAQSFGLKTIVRLNRAGGPDQEEMMRHPAILTYMIGDEPQIGPKLDDHILRFEAITKKYPQFKPVTCTIFDSWGTGDVRDPNRIYNEYLQKYKLVRLGRYYPFRKLDYGVGKPLAYKTTLEAASIMLGLEADTAREWWLVPPFFGASLKTPTPAQFWRNPTGLEITNLMHLALAHRCTGLIGWGTHSHANWHGLLFDGVTMQVTSEETFAAMEQFGAQLMRVKPLLQAFTPALIQIHKSRPFALDVQARWLKTGQMAIYAVNRDIENVAAVDLLAMIADRALAKTGKPSVQAEAFVAEIAAVKDALTDTAIGWKHEVMDKRFDYLRINDRIGPGAARLYIVYGRQNGGFSEKAIPAGAREHWFDKAFSSID